MLRKLDPDIVHGIGAEHGYPYIAVTSNYPSVITIHGIMYHIVRVTGHERSFRHRMTVRLERESIQRAEHIIAISPYVYEELKNKTQARIYMVENAIYPGFFTRSTSEEYDIVFVGMIQELKRVHDLLQAVKIVKAHIPDVQVRIIGDPVKSAGGYYREILSYISENDMAGNVRLLGQKSQAEVVDIVSKAKILVHPSLFETCPMVIVEAMALGKPVVATDVGGIRYLVKDMETGLLVPPRDVKTLAEKILTILKDKQLRETMAKEARTTIQGKHHPDIVAKKTIEVYKSVLRDCSKRS